MALRFKDDDALQAFLTRTQGKANPPTEAKHEARARCVLDLPPVVIERRPKYVSKVFAQVLQAGAIAFGILACASTIFWALAWVVTTWIARR